MFFVALAFLILGLVSFGAASAAIVFHIKKYSVQGDRSSLFLAVFVAGTFVWLALLISSFLAVPWNDLINRLQQ